MKNNIILFYKRDVYGVEKIYVAEQNMATILRDLTGRKTLSSSDIGCLKLLGFTFKEVMRPIK